MRIVSFAELGKVLMTFPSFPYNMSVPGVDCVYTVEASLAGSESHHYLMGDCMQLGKSLCCGCVTDIYLVGAL
jgi:hypothetical protein